jgi:uncharacterized membrane protein YoaT (DUF817 family)
MTKPNHAIDSHGPRFGAPALQVLADGFEDLVWFGIKELRACVFGGALFLAIFLLPRQLPWGIARYDVLLCIALLIQAGMLYWRIETLDEFKTILVFHALGFSMELFKTSAGIHSWSYPDFAYSKVFGVPLFAGFMYAAIGSYIMQAWRLLGVRIEHHPPYWMSGLLAIAIYANFFTHHFIGDARWYLASIALGLYARSTVVFRPHQRDRRLSLLASFVLIGFFIWLAENLGTFFGIWRYPNQIGAWAMVSVGKWSSWAMLVTMTFALVTNLKHIKQTVYIPR